MQRRFVLLAALCVGVVAPSWAAAPEPEPFDGDPFKSFQWVDLKKEFLGAKAQVQFDPRVKVQGPAFAEDPMNVPITVSTDLAGVQRLIVLVDRNPIRKVLELQPLAAQPGVSFRFKLEQASPVRALAQTADGVWHVGGTWVDSSGGGCTVAGATRASLGAARAEHRWKGGEDTPLQQKETGKFSRGDLWRVTLSIDAEQDMTWVVVSDPIPAGSRILGEGDGRDSRIATLDEDRRARRLWPSFVERSFANFRAYYEVVPKGRFSIDYTLRINNAGEFALPPTRVEALYAPEMFGESPNAPVRVLQGK